MSNITYSDSFKQYSLYNGKKNEKGFYLSILEKIDLIVDDALVNFEVPMVAHFIIEQPINYRINQSVKRIISNEAKIRNIDTPKFYYISVIERKRKGALVHQHLIIVLDKGDYDFYKKISFELRKFSSNSKVKLAKRKYSDRPISIDNDTGEIRMMGSAYFHNLRWETPDAFQRLSYIAKVETKLSPKFSSSRLTN